jgi:hypothetical protein
MATSILAGIATEETLVTVQAVMESQKAIQQSLDELNQTLVLLVNEILAQQPRLDVNNRATVNVETCVTHGVTISSGTISTLTNLSGGNTAMMPFNFSDAGLTTIYDNLVVS